MLRRAAAMTGSAAMDLADKVRTYARSLAPALLRLRSGGLFGGLPENLFHALALRNEACGDEQQVG